MKKRVDCLLATILLVTLFLVTAGRTQAQGCYNYSSYARASYYTPYYQPTYYYPTYYTYTPYYNPYYPSYYGSTQASDQTQNIATQVKTLFAQEKADAAKAAKDDEMLSLLRKLNGGPGASDNFKKVEKEIPPPYPTPPLPIQPQQQTSIKTAVDPKWKEVVDANCISCHSGKMDKARNGNLDLSDLSTVSYVHRLASVNKIARKEMPKNKPAPDDKVGPWSGLASDWAAAAEVQYAKKE